MTVAPYGVARVFALVPSEDLILAGFHGNGPRVVGWCGRKKRHGLRRRTAELASMPLGRLLFPPVASEYLRNLLEKS
jgi:hypothetical protein